MTAHADLEITLDLTAQELLEPPPLQSLVEVDDIGTMEDIYAVDDICAMDPTLQPLQIVANADDAVLAAATDDSMEIEITAEQIDDLLGEQF
jgi:hypothetical protein